MTAHSGWGPTVLALVGLVGALTVAVLRPPRVREAVVAVPFAGAVLAVGGVSWPAARHEVAGLLPVVGFLVAVLVLARVCAAEGLFEAIGDLARRRSQGDPQRLLVLVVAVAALTTAILSLDTTVVLLTPVVVAIVRRSRVGAGPYLLVTVHLANSASLLLPVSNLTNLLAMRQGGLDFVSFTARMALPWLAALAIEYAAVRIGYRGVLAAGRPEVAGAPVVGAPVDNAPVDNAPVASASVDDASVDGDAASDAPPVPVPRFALTVVLATLAGFAVTGPFGVQPVWVAMAGAVVLTIRALRRHHVDARAVASAAGIDFAVFVLAIGVLVLGLAVGPLGRALASVLPTGSGWLDLLALAAIAAVVSNVVNNLPATLLLLGLLPAGVGVLPVLAVLVGVDVGPNLAYPGSLATLLWRRALPADLRPSLREFTVLGVVTVPLVLVAAVTGLWLSGVVAPQ